MKLFAFISYVHSFHAYIFSSLLPTFAIKTIHRMLIVNIFSPLIGDQLSSSTGFLDELFLLLPPHTICENVQLERKRSVRACARRCFVPIIKILLPSENKRINFIRSRRDECINIPVALIMSHIGIVVVVASQNHKPLSISSNILFK